MDAMTGKFLYIIGQIYLILFMFSLFVQYSEKYYHDYWQIKHFKNQILIINNQSINCEHFEEINMEAVCWKNVSSYSIYSSYTKP